MKTFFILGRNQLLSRLEVLSFLDARKRNYTEVLFEHNLLVLEFPGDEKLDINEFGGVLKLGRVLFEGSQEAFEQYVAAHELIPADKFSYQVFGNGDVGLVKEQCKKMRKKATLKSGGSRIVYQDGHSENLAHTDYSLLLHEVDKNIFFGLVSQEYDVEGVKIRDMEKPFRREHLAISPRLSKILINLSGAKPGSLLFDPFCGIGGILMESLVKNIKCYGVDVDKKAVQSAVENMGWLKGRFPIKVRYTIEVGDSRHAPDLQFGAIATETPLGEVVRKKPDKKLAKKIVGRFEQFIVPALKRFRQVKRSDALIAITFPAVNDVRVDVHRLAELAGLKVVHSPILEGRPDQFIARDIVVLQ